MPELDDVLRAQAIIDQNNTATLDAHETINTNVQNPKERAGGEVNPKAPHLDMDMQVLLPIIFFLAVALAFIMGIFVGFAVKQNRPTTEVPVSTRAGEFEYKTTTPVLAPQVAAIPAVEKKKPTASSVMKYASPKILRKRHQQQEMAKAIAFMNDQQKMKEAADSFSL